MTARDVIKSALRKLGVLASGETPSAGELADGLDALNDMLDSWSNERLLVYQIVREEFTLVVGTQTYTIGTGGTLNTTRPMRIENAAIELQGTSPQEVPLVLLTPEQWARVPMKGLTSPLPTGLYFDDAFPLANISLSEIPTVAQHLVLYSWKPFAAFANASDEVSFPQGYARALKANLVLELAPEYGKEPTTANVIIATESKGQIKSKNIKPRFLAADPLRAGRRFNIYTGE